MNGNKEAQATRASFHYFWINCRSMDEVTNVRNIANLLAMVSGINIDWDVFGKDGAGIIRVNARVTTAPKPISTENHYTSEVSRAKKKGAR